MIEVDEKTGAITIVRGDSGYVTVPLFEIVEDAETGEKVEQPYTLQPGDTLRFAAAKRYGSTEDECIIIREIEAPEMKLEFYPEDTKNLKFGEYKYDLELTTADGYVDTILMSTFKVSEEVY